MKLRIRFAAFFLAALSIGHIACTPAETGTGAELNGRVTLDGKPLELGMVLFLPQSDVAGNGGVTAQISKEGTYSVNNVPIGSVRVVVKTSHLKGMIMAGKMAPQKSAQPVKGMSAPTGVPSTILLAPADYEDPAKTPIKITVEKGIKTFDVEMKSK